MVLPLAWWWVVEHGLALAAALLTSVALLEREDSIAMVSPSAVEPSSWPEWLERSPSMVWL
jgi:hypothetical protein